LIVLLAAWALVATILLVAWNWPLLKLLLTGAGAEVGDLAWHVRLTVVELLLQMRILVLKGRD